MFERPFVGLFFDPHTGLRPRAQLDGELPSASWLCITGLKNGSGGDDDAAAFHGRHGGGIVPPEYAYRTMDWFDYGPLPGDAPYWACIPFAVFLLAAFGGAIYYIVLLYRATREEGDWAEVAGGTEEE